MLTLWLRSKSGEWAEITRENLIDFAKEFERIGASIGTGAVIGERASIGTGAVIEKTIDCIVIGPIGSRNGNTTFYKSNGELHAICGCYSGTLAEFSERVQSVHGENEHGKRYQAAIEYVKKIMA